MPVLVYQLGCSAVCWEGGDRRGEGGKNRVQLRFFHCATSAKLAREAEWFCMIVGLTRTQFKPIAHSFKEFGG